MAIEQKAIKTVYEDGSVVWSNLRNKKGIPVIGLNDTYTASRVTQWYDGTPMTDLKADGEIWFKERETGQYFRVNLPNWGETFLEKDTIAQMRSLTPTEILLLKAGYYKGVTLNGYHEDKPKFDKPINYYLSETTADDDGGSVIAVGGVKLEHEFVQEVDVRYFGAKGDDISDDTLYIQNASNYCSKITLVKKTILFSEAVSYRTSDTIYIANGVSVNMKSPLKPLSVFNKPCLEVGKRESTSFKCKYILRVVSEQNNWSNDEYIGINIINANECFIDIPQALFFTKNVVVTGITRGNAYNHIVLGDIGHGKEQLCVESKDGGWSNSNRYYGGRLWVLSSLNQGISRYGIVIRSNDGYRQNNNSFYSTSIELVDASAKIGNPNGEAVPIVIENGRQNNFLYIRDEGNSATTVRTLNDSFANTVQTAFSAVFSSYIKNAQDLGLFPSTTFKTDIQSPHQEISWEVYNASSLKNKLVQVATGGQTSSLDGDLILQNIGASVPTANVSGITMGEDYVSIPNSVGVGVRINTDIRKRFNVALDYVGENAGRIYIVCRDSSGNIITTQGTVRSSGRYGSPTPENPYGIIISEQFGGSFVIATGTNARRDLGNIMQYFVVSEDVKQISVLVTAYSGNAQIKSLQVYSLDGYTSIVPFRQSTLKVSAVAPDIITFNGDFVMDASGARLGWKQYGGVWREFGGNATTTVKGLVNQSAASADTATQASGETPTKAEFDALLAEFRDVKNKLRTAGTLAPNTP